MKLIFKDSIGSILKFFRFLFAPENPDTISLSFFINLFVFVFLLLLLLVFLLIFRLISKFYVVHKFFYSFNRLLTLYINYKLYWIHNFRVIEDTFSHIAIADTYRFFCMLQYRYFLIYLFIFLFISFDYHNINSSTFSHYLFFIFLILTIGILYLLTHLHFIIIF